MSFHKLFFDDIGYSPYWHMHIDENELQRRGGDIWSYSRGSRCEQSLRVPCYIDHLGQQADSNNDALTTAPIVSNRLANLLNDIAPNDIQLIPAELDAPGDWYVVNVLAVVDAIDYKKSIITYYDADHPRRAGQISGVVRLIIDNERVGNHHIFRLKDFIIVKIISDELKVRCEKAFMTNMKFIPTNLDDWLRYRDDPDSDEWCLRPWRSV